MKKFFKFTALLVALCIAFSMSAFAHSGRTDSSGGHRDNKNASGLGSYHYHHGYSAHLHTNGICPYSSTPSSSVDKTTVKAKSITEKTSISDIKSYINGDFIPSFNYKNTTYIIAEDLNNYGFDVEWNGNERSVKIKRNAIKLSTPSETENPSETYEIKPTDIITYVYDSSTQDYSEVTSYNIGGQTIIKLSSVGNTLWDSTSRTIDISV